MIFSSYLIFKTLAWTVFIQSVLFLTGLIWFIWFKKGNNETENA